MNDILKNLSCDMTFRPEEGLFRSKLAEIAVADADEDGAELFSGQGCDILVNISRYSLEEDLIRFTVVSDSGEKTLACDLSDLGSEERRDFEQQLLRQIESHPESAVNVQSDVITRKNAGGMLDIHQASQKLGCTQKKLKSNIPCTDYSYIEVDGKKEIQEYFWSQDLISRLCEIKSAGAKPEDVRSVAEECCHGDLKWAEDLLMSLGGSVPTAKRNEAVSQDAARPSSKNRSRGFTHNRPPRKKT